MQDKEKLTMSTGNILEELEAYFRERSDVCLAFLFGSMAKGKTNRNSDADVAVYFTEGYDINVVRNMATDIEGIVMREVDLIVLNDASPSIAWSAMRGIPLSIKNQEFYLEYMLNVSREAEDFNIFLLDLWRLRTNRRKREIHASIGGGNDGFGY